MSDVTLQNIILIFIFIVPGFVALDYIKSKIPYKRLSHFEAIISCLISSFIVNSFLFTVIIYVPQFEKAERFIRIFISRTNKDFLDLAVIFYFIVIYVLTSIVIAKVFGAFNVWIAKRFNQNIFPVFLRVTPSKASKKIAFVKITMKNNKIYTGQLKYWPIDYDLITNSEKDIYIVEPYLLQDTEWERLDADGILLNTRDVFSIEFNFADIQNQP